MDEQSEYKKYVLEWTEGDGYTWSADQFLIIETKSKLDIEHHIFNAVETYETQKNLVDKRLEQIEGHWRHVDECKKLERDYPIFNLNKLKTLDVEIDYSMAKEMCEYGFNITEFDEWVQTKTVRID